MITNFGIYVQQNDVDIKTLAKKTGITVETLKKYMTGDSYPKWAMAREIGRVCKITKEEFLDFFEVY